MRPPQLKNVMTPFPYSVDVEAPVDEAERFMREHKIRHLPVMEKGVLKGVITDRDIKLMLGPDWRGKLAGVFTVTDACRAFADYLDGGASRRGR
jgi:CBS domain-containing protein